MSGRGRGRGRARGRARGQAVQEQEASRAPGRQPSHSDVPQPCAQPSGPPSEAAGPLPTPLPGSGRASHRGGTRTEPRPGDQGAEAAAMAVPTAAMQGMNLGRGDESRRPGGGGFDRGAGGRGGGGRGGGRGEGGRGRGGRDDRRKRDELIIEEPHTRPQHATNKTGTSGTVVKLKSNYFRVESSPNWHLYQYHVAYSPEVPHKGMRSQMLKKHVNVLGTTRAFDGMVLFLPHLLNPNPMELLSKLPSDENTNVRIIITLTNELPPTSPTCIQMFNVIFRRVLRMIDYQQIGRHFFNPTEGVTIPQHKLEVWPGFITSILQYEKDILLNAEVSNKIMRSDTVLDILYDIHDQTEGRGRGIKSFHETSVKKLVGEIVLTRYNNKTYKIHDINWRMTPTSTFESHEGRTIDFVAYYKETYQREITDKDQPLLVSLPKERDKRRGMDQPILLVPELCTLTGLSDEVRNDFHVMKDLAVHTRTPPDRREATLMKFINKIHNNQEVKTEMEGWGLAFSDKVVGLQGRILPAEKINQRNSSFGYRPQEADWSKEMRGQKLISCVSLYDWIVIFTRRDSDKAQDFLQTLSRVAPPMGMEIGKPDMFELADDNPQNFVRTINEKVKPSTQLVCCILPSNRKDRYDAIKKTCCLHKPVPSQVILQRTLGKKQMLMSVATKIAIQLNCKLGGETWSVTIPLKGLMVVGVDSYHDSASRGRSVGAFVASMNSAHTRYYSRCTFQHNMQELIDGLKLCMASALKQYHKMNQALPTTIYIYRDGVGDGQLPSVYEHEIPQLLDSFRSIGSDYNPRVSIIVVKKRINTRFFAEAGPKLVNPPPGTVIDNTITKPEWYDFFLVSQSVRQGTVTPTHYNVVWDTVKMPPDRVQMLTYKLTHLYFNWPGTIRVPAPCQYAHKMAFLVGQSLHEEPHSALCDKLYYL